MVESSHRVFLDLQIIPLELLLEVRSARSRVVITRQLILCAQVFGYVLPQDLLRLARVTKSFRAIVLNRASRRIWKVSFARMVGLPACPTNLSFPAWANLLYGTLCQVRVFVLHKFVSI